MDQVNISEIGNILFYLINILVYDKEKSKQQLILEYSTIRFTIYYDYYYYYTNKIRKYYTIKIE